MTEEDLRRIREDDDEEKLDDSPLQGFLLRLVASLTTDSQEYRSSEKEKGAFSGVVAGFLPSTTTPVENSSPIPPSTPPDSNQPLPETHESDARGHKRKLSALSFDPLSTEATPAKLIQPEPIVQGLQNTFINNIVDKLWRGKVAIPWAKGRRMFLTYTEYSLSGFSLTVGRTTCLFSIKRGTIPTRSSSVASEASPMAPFS